MCYTRNIIPHVDVEVDLEALVVLVVDVVVSLLEHVPDPARPQAFSATEPENYYPN